MATTRNNIKSRETSSNLRGDYHNIAFLLLLYVLQGIPIGLSTAIPLLLQNRKVSYSEQALFSFVTWPFSLKLLWAPIVDSIFWRRMGRRKSWLIPTQLGIGIFMLILSGFVKSLLADVPEEGKKPDIYLLTAIFLLLNFLAATQDIAVDGWALTMLKKRNVGYASTCNTAGQTAGFFIGNVIFLALESADFCNKYLRSHENQLPVGILTLQSFLSNFGMVFIIVTILITFLKSEKTEVHLKKADLAQDSEATIRLTRRKASQLRRTSINDCEDSSDDAEDAATEKELSIVETYSLLYKIIKLPSIRLFALILLTCRIGFAAPDAVSGLKLVEAGVSKENLAMLAVPMVPLQIILPWIISRITCGPRPLDLFARAYPYRLIFGFIFPLIVYATPSMKLVDQTFPFYYYIGLIVVYAFHQITVYSMFVSSMAFNASISDPSIGGSYMTLLNTIQNLGGNWPSTTSLWLVEKLSIKSCTEVCQDIPSNISQNGSSTDGTAKTQDCRIDCTNLIDGYYIECIICVVLGFIWLWWGSNRLRRIQSLPPTAWSISMNRAIK